MERQSRQPPPWHAMPVAEVLEAVASRAEGLRQEEVDIRLAMHGPNLLTPPKARGAMARLLDQFRNVLIYVLVAATLITALLGHWIDSAVIAAVVLVNGVIGFIQEGRAEQALAAIRDLLSPRAMVLRDGRRVTLAAEALVPGDIVFVQSGDKVPADLRLIRAKTLRMQEALLTGESMPVDKAVAPNPADAPIGERWAMAFSGTMVAHGQGTGVVVATGDATELGHVSALLARIERLSTPLLRQMARFGRWLTLAILVLAAATFLVGTNIHGFAASEMFLAAVGLAVAAIPEGLPAIMTVTLAIGVERMARRNAIIRRLPAVETLGAVSVICSDKTGTFTRNEMTVQSIATSGQLFEVSGTGYAPQGDFLLGGTSVALDYRPRLQELVLGAALCSDASVREVEDEWLIDGDPMEAALLVVGMKAGLDPELVRKSWPRDDEIPFESAHRFMASLHHDHEGHGVIYVKGAPERLIEMCARQRDGTMDRALDKDYWCRRMAEMSARGERILALAAKPATQDHRTLRFADVEEGLTLLGLFGLADPPREEAIASVARCAAAGVRVKMITGDHAGTAKAIAGRLGLVNTDVVLSGADLDHMDASTLAGQALEVDIFARTSPEHKLRLVEALQASGRIVAMTGDGVNDAPALKRADVGVAMGRKGSEAAKEAAEMVLADDNFASIAHAVEEGRTVYDNLKKAILFILPTNVGEALTIMIAIALGRMLPITAVQILWVNMVTAVTLALALAFEPAESDVMKRPPRRADAPLLSAFLIWRIAFVSLILVSGVFGVFIWLRNAGADIHIARTAAVNTLVMFEVFYLFNVRRLQASAFAGLWRRGARILWAAVAVVIALQLLFTYAPFMQVLFHSAPMTLAMWLAILAVAGSIFLLVELEKTLVAFLAGREK
ncbi:MAG: cation-transporting P-type ATPase [Pseudomonadota bacterium]